MVRAVTVGMYVFPLLPFLPLVLLLLPRWQIQDMDPTFDIDFKVSLSLANNILSTDGVDPCVIRQRVFHCQCAVVVSRVNADAIRLLQRLIIQEPGNGRRWDTADVDGQGEGGTSTYRLSTLQFVVILQCRVSCEIRSDL